MRTTLTDRERHALRLVCDHLTSKQIARELGVSPHTVDQRIRGALRKLGVSSRREAARLYHDNDMSSRTPLRTALNAHSAEPTPAPAPRMLDGVS